MDEEIRKQIALIYWWIIPISRKNFEGKLQYYIEEL